MRHILLAPAALVFLALPSLSQSAQPAQTSDALALLQRVAQHYAEAKSYYIQSTEERTSTTEFSRDWNKSILIAAEAPGNRFHFEGHAIMGSAMQISDGKTQWTYHVNEGRYTEKPASSPGPHSAFMAMADAPIMNARSLRAILEHLAQPLKSAEFLPDQELTVDGKPILCKVILIRAEDLMRPIQTTRAIEPSGSTRNAM